jgi:transcriptional regulator with XRE-family HTH domain
LSIDVDEFRELCRCAQNMGGVFVFYDRYAQLCKQKGVSMSAAAEEAGFAKSLVSKWKKLKIEVPSPEILQKLSAYFGMTIAELLGEEQKENPVAAMGNEALKENGYYELNEENKKFIDNIIVQLIKSQSGG